MDFNDPLKHGKKQELLNTDLVKQYRNFDVPPGHSPTHQLPGQAHNLTPPGWNPATGNLDSIPKNLPHTKPVNDIIRPIDRNQGMYTTPPTINPVIPRLITPTELMKTGHAVEGIHAPPTTIGKYGSKRKSKRHKKEKKFYGI